MLFVSSLVENPIACTEMESNVSNLLCSLLYCLNPEQILVSTG